MAKTAVSPELLHAALIDLLIAAAPFRAGRGMPLPRAALDDAMIRARRALKFAGLEGVDHDWEAFKRMAAEADAEARQRPGFRADLDG